MGADFERSTPSREYGVVSRKVMRDASLPCEAKAIYSYICSFAGDGSTSFPGVDTMISELDMSRARFYKYRGMLVSAGYLSIEKGRREGSKYEHNVYRIMDSDQPCSEHGRIVVAEVGQSQNLTAETAKSSQVDGRSRFGTVENRSANNGWLVGEFQEYEEGLDLPAKEDSHEGRNPSEEAITALKAMISDSVNRNRTTKASDRETMARRIDFLASEGYSPAEVREAWGLAQARCRKQDLDGRYYPQLYRFLVEEAPSAVRTMRRAKKAAQPTTQPGEAFAAVERSHASDPEVSAFDARLAELVAKYREASTTDQKSDILSHHAKVADERNAVVWSIVAKEMPWVEIPERFRA